jgi:hypothetical protein
MTKTLQITVHAIETVTEALRMPGANPVHGGRAALALEILGYADLAHILERAWHRHMVATDAYKIAEATADREQDPILGPITIDNPVLIEARGTEMMSRKELDDAVRSIKEIYEAQYAY